MCVLCVNGRLEAICHSWNCMWLRWWSLAHHLSHQDVSRKFVKSERNGRPTLEKTKENHFSMLTYLHFCCSLWLHVTSSFGQFSSVDAQRLDYFRCTTSKCHLAIQFNGNGKQRDERRTLPCDNSTNTIELELEHWNISNNVFPIDKQQISHSQSLTVADVPYVKFQIRIDKQQKNENEFYIVNHP